ncbi:hypothetical protein FQN50_005499 [Emmonsiellopsis sp. PD_5]|nr:hypothetical protein FQN50_005499 [Emmonsiellopsis sp. PD_5]
MSSTTLLDYLTAPNPVIDSTYSLEGLPTKVEPDEPLEVVDWVDFTYDTLMSLYGEVLRTPHARLPGISPPLSRLERQVFDEDSLDHLFSRSTTPPVNEGLRIACEACYPNQPGINMTRGGRARGSADNPKAPNTLDREINATQETEGRRTFPDWAGVRIDRQSGVYMNQCPGDTKLATKWYSTMERTKEQYFWPFAQLINYCGKAWNTRYGYVITQEELVVLRISRAIIGSGIAGKRSPRTAIHPPALPGHEEVGFRSSSPLFVPSSPPAVSPRSSAEQPRHRRNVSVGSASSAMSIDAVSRNSRQPSLTESMGGLSVREHDELSLGTDQAPSSERPASSSDQTPSSQQVPSSDPWRDNGRGGEYRPIEMKSISWHNSGPGKLTVKLALWWLHMMCAAPNCETSISPVYPDLDAWVLHDGVYQHITTGLKENALPMGAKLLPVEPEPTCGVPATPPRQAAFSLRRSSPLSSSPPTVEDTEQTT